jgi:hypothetical protein
MDGTAYYLIRTRAGRPAVCGVYTTEGVARWWAARRGWWVVTAADATDADRAAVAEYEADMARLFSE